MKEKTMEQQENLEWQNFKKLIEKLSKLVKNQNFPTSSYSYDGDDEYYNGELLKNKKILKLIKEAIDVLKEILNSLEKNKTNKNFISKLFDEDVSDFDQNISRQFIDKIIEKYKKFLENIISSDIKLFYKIIDEINELKNNKYWTWKNTNNMYLFLIDNCRYEHYKNKKIKNDIKEACKNLNINFNQLKSEINKERSRISENTDIQEKLYQIMKYLVLNKNYKIKNLIT